MPLRRPMSFSTSPRAVPRRAGPPRAGRRAPERRWRSRLARRACRRTRLGRSARLGTARAEPVHAGRLNGARCARGIAWQAADQPLQIQDWRTRGSTIAVMDCGRTCCHRARVPLASRRIQDFPIAAARLTFRRSPTDSSRSRPRLPSAAVRRGRDRLDGDRL